MVVCEVYGQSRSAARWNESCVRIRVLSNIPARSDQRLPRSIPSSFSFSGSLKVYGFFGAPAVELPRILIWQSSYATTEYSSPSAGITTTLHALYCHGSAVFDWMHTRAVSPCRSVRFSFSRRISWYSRSTSSCVIPSLPSDLLAPARNSRYGASDSSV